MKNFLIKLFFVCCGFSFFTTVFADGWYDVCPTEKKIREATFKWAKPADWKGKWTLVSAPIFDKGHNWYIEFDTYLPNINNPTEILELGQEFFQIAPIKLVGYETWNWCDYGSHVIASCDDRKLIALNRT